MVRIKRTEYARLVREGEIIIRDEDLKDLKKRIQIYAKDPDVIPDFTDDMIVNIINHDWNDERDIEIEVKVYNNSFYKTMLYDYAWDILNDWIWEADFEEVDGETDDYDDYAEIED